ncbi:C-C chemokine receptor type 1-like [Chelmon rostratus]|uniref:C-C chemokine receptor type 1-like n=1 Tax=Chelmon rostratus TaxID=109905 RepID=UPI001BE7CCC1|nr:C-C chemokine receptor type 1-like [Chelmon rostratus]
MSDYGENTSLTPAYDYSSYNDLIGDFAPCESNDVRAFGKVFLPALYCLVFILGFIGNGLVVCVLVRQRNQTNLTDICLFNLALSDLLFITTLPFYAHFSRVSAWPFGDFMCRFAAASHNTGFFSSIFFMVVMTLDRYMVIMHSFKVARYRTLKAGIALTVLVWMLSLSVSLPAFIFTKVTNNSSGPSCHPDSENNAWRLYNLFAANILGLLIPLMVMIACYSCILVKLVNMRSAKKHRIVKLILSIVVAFFLFWAPYNICLFLNFLKAEGKLKGNECTLEANLGLALTVTEAFAFSHCCLNPIIYAFVGQRFRKQVLQLLRTWVPGIHCTYTEGWSDNSYRKSSVMFRSSDVTPTFIK